MNILKSEQFDINRFSIPAQTYFNANDLQHTLYPKYNHPTTGLSDCLILTEPIRLAKGGITPFNEKWHSSEESCMNIRVNTENPGMVNLITNVCEPIDNLMKKELCKLNGNFIIIKKQDNTSTPLQKLNYHPIIRIISNNYNDDEDDIKPGPSNTRIILNLHKRKNYTKLDNKGKPLIDITTRIFIPENKFAPVGERAFKTTPEPITCLNDVRQLVPWNSTVRFIFKVQKFWSQKQPTNGTKLCGISLVCEQIYVIDNPQWINELKFNPNKVPVGMGLITAAEIKTNVVNYKLEEDVEVSDGDEAPKPPKKFTIKDCKSDTDSDFDFELEEYEEDKKLAKQVKSTQIPAPVQNKKK